MGESRKCWICDSLADSAEHRIKKSDIVSKYGKDNYKGDNSLCIVSYDDKRDVIQDGTNATVTSRKDIVQGANSNLLKYDKILCSHCNNARTQPFDKAYEAFIAYFNENESEIAHKRFIDFRKIYGDDFENEQRNLYKYFVKSFGCRLAHFNHPIPSDMVELLGLDSFSTKLRLNFSVNEDILYLGRLDSDLKKIIGNGDIKTNQSYIDRINDVKFYLYSEYYDWLHIDYYYNVLPNGNLDLTWAADDQFIYLGSFYSSELSDEERQEAYNKARTRNMSDA